MQYFIIAHVYCILRVYSIRCHTDWQGRRIVKESAVPPKTWRTVLLHGIVLGFVPSWPSVSQCDLRKIYTSSQILLFKNIEIILIKIKATMFQHALIIKRLVLFIL